MGSSTDTVRKVVTYLKENKEGTTPTGLSTELKINYSSVMDSIHLLRQLGLLQSDRFGKFLRVKLKEERIEDNVKV